MAGKPETPQPFSLKRWSQRKLAAARAEPHAPVPPPLAPSAAMPAEAPPAIPEPATLPPVETLTFDSDFAAFMQPKVNEETKRAALKKLFTDPSFNVMDGLDIYTGDYTQSDPMPAGMLDKLSAVYAMLEPVPPPPDKAADQADAAAIPDATPVDAAAAPGQVAPEAAPASEAAADTANKPA